MPVHAAREHVATEAPARGDGDDHGRPPTGFALSDREAHAPANYEVNAEWAASFWHGFYNSDSVRASNMPRSPHRVFTIVGRTRPSALRTKHPYALTLGKKSRS